MNPNNKLGMRKGMLVCLCMVMAICLVLCSCSLENSVGDQPTELPGTDLQNLDTTAEPTTQTDAGGTVFIETSLCQLRFPEEVYDVLELSELSQGGEILEIFYAVTGESKTEAFRILFSPVESSDALGILRMDSGDLYVSVHVCSYNDEDFADESARGNYYAVVSSLNTVLESVYADARFFTPEQLPVHESGAELLYWKVNLPENMEWEESREENYTVSFFGKVAGQSVKLYSVGIGESVPGNQIGFFSVDGQWMPVAVETFGLPSTQGWTDSQITKLYTMMSSVNEVIDAIMSDENYSGTLPE